MNIFTTFGQPISTNYLPSAASPLLLDSNVITTLENQQQDVLKMFQVLNNYQGINAIEMNGQGNGICGNAEILNFTCQTSPMISPSLISPDIFEQSFKEALSSGKSTPSTKGKSRKSKSTSPNPPKRRSSNVCPPNVSEKEWQRKLKNRQFAQRTRERRQQEFDELKQKYGELQAKYQYLQDKYDELLKRME